MLLSGARKSRPKAALKVKPSQVEGFNAFGIERPPRKEVTVQVNDERIQSLEKRVARIEQTLCRLASIRGATEKDVLKRIKQIFESFDSEIRQERSPYKPPMGATLRRITPDEE